MRLMSFLSTVVVVLILSGCIDPAARYPAGDGLLCDSNGVPLDVEVLVP